MFHLVKGRCHGLYAGDAAEVSPPRGTALAEPLSSLEKVFLRFPSSPLTRRVRLSYCSVLLGRHQNKKEKSVILAGVHTFGKV